MIIIHRIMQHLPIIPHRQTPYLPLEPTRKLRLRLVLVQELQQRLTLGLCPAVEALGMCYVEVQNLLACLRVRAHGWVAR